MSDRATQTSRILKTLLHCKGFEVSALELHVSGSGKALGFVASLSRRISDCRALGHTITCRKETHQGQVRTFYKLHLKQGEPYLMRSQPIPQAQATKEIEALYGNGVQIKFA